MAVLSIGQIYSLARDAGWNHAQAIIATTLALAESGGKTDAVGGPNTNGTYDYGLWQVNSVHGYDKAKLLNDPKYNAEAAYAIYKKQGWKAWTTWKSPGYSQNLPKVQSDPDVKKGKGGLQIPIPPFVPGTQFLPPLTPDDPLGPVDDVIDTATDIPGAVKDALNTLTSGETWKRVALVVGGGVALTLGVIILANEFLQKVPTPVTQATKALKK